MISAFSFGTRLHFDFDILTCNRIFIHCISTFTQIRHLNPSTNAEGIKIKKTFVFI